MSGQQLQHSSMFAVTNTTDTTPTMLPCPEPYQDHSHCC